MYGSLVDSGQLYTVKAYQGRSVKALGRQVGEEFKMTAIHYKLRTDFDNSQDVRRLVDALREFALDLPFKEVGEVKEFNVKERYWLNDSDDMGDSDLKSQAEGHAWDDFEGHFPVFPHKIIAFSTLPGKGCHRAPFGFSKYPAFIEPEEQRLATKLMDGNGEAIWSPIGWCSQFRFSPPSAFDHRNGGIENRLHCHLVVIKMLDFIKATGLVHVEVNDEGEYWENRDLKALTETLGGQQTLMEKDGKSTQTVTPSFPAFEHLESKVLERLTELRRRLKDKK